MFCSVTTDEGIDAVLHLSGQLTYICMPHQTSSHQIHAAGLVIN